jgi:hypothetical protein
MYAQHDVLHGIPYAFLVFTHVVESLVFVPIMVRIFLCLYLQDVYVYTQIFLRMYI